MRPAQSSTALRFGSAWHQAMEARWRGGDYDDALAAALPDGATLDELQVATLASLLAGYFERFGDRDELVKELAPEVEFRGRMQGSRSFEASGRIDGLAVLRDGRLALIEHKTTSDSVAPDSDYWLSLRLNPQILQYVLVARVLGRSEERRVGKECRSRWATDH